MYFIADSFVFIFIFVVSLVVFFKSKHKRMTLMSLFVCASYFYLNTFYDVVKIFLIAFFSFFLAGKIKIPKSLIFYFIFVIWGIVTLFYSSGMSFGMMMIVKFLIPVLFFIIGYSFVENEEWFETLISKIEKDSIFFIVISSYPFYLLGNSILPIFRTWSAGNAYIFSVLICVPLSLYFITKQKKHLFFVLLFLLPPLTLIRRAAIGASFIAIGLFYVYKKGIRSVLNLSLFFVISIFFILFIPQLKTRFFGGDKGDISGMSNREILQSSNEYISTSGREVMWNYMMNKYYINNEIIGCGLGTMKSFLVTNVNGESEHFAMLHNDILHILIETGIVGVFLFGLFFVITIYITIFALRSRRSSRVYKSSALCALLSVVSLLFCMYFGNIFSEMYAISIAFVFVGMFYKLKNIQKT